VTLNLMRGGEGKGRRGRGEEEIPWRSAWPRRWEMDRLRLPSKGSRQAGRLADSSAARKAEDEGCGN